MKYTLNLLIVLAISLLGAHQQASAANQNYNQMQSGAPAKEIDSPFVFAGGSGTLEDPYLIETAHQLNAVRKNVEGHYKLIADIDLSDWGNWIPIGSNAAYGMLTSGWNKAEKGAIPFHGSFDGNGHVVSGMQIVINEETPYLTERVNERAYGLFGATATNPVEHMIKNLGVVNFNIDVNYTNLKKNTKLDLFAGAICGGRNNGIDIINCYSRGGKININIIGNEEFKAENIFGERPDGSPRVSITAGGICAYTVGEFFGNRAITHIEKCFNDSEITVNVENATYNINTAGITGEMMVTHIHECYNSGNITVPLGLENVYGGCVSAVASGICSSVTMSDIPQVFHKGPEKSSFVQNCYNTGALTGRSASGIVHFTDTDLHLENCYSTGHIFINEMDITIENTSNGNNVICKLSKTIPFGAEFVRQCYGNGTSVAGPKWKTSEILNRKVLVSIPEDTHPNKVYVAEPGIVGTFTDIKTNLWCAKLVQWALDKNIISNTDATFSPNKTCTREQLLTMLWKAAGSPESSTENPFTDLKPTDSYYKAALWALDQGIVKGTTLAPATACKRSEFIIALWKSSGSPATQPLAIYTDTQNHETEIGKAVGWAYLNGIMGGTGKLKFSPDKTLTRAQVLVYLNRAIK